ncbi:zinc ribbon domain-containing protein [Nocardioides lijunqiniae]|uniref:zinc ribbon domain-containing protein n=1 Tax=Nocardioides lijunqiniae TaxID=2760832 RepID=UPI001877BE9C|nr:zinc ribbon domain-containing protein [Nocardioides lijunqiniae]
MTRYADPLTCPDCRANLPVGAQQCPACHLPLAHPIAAELLGTLTYADTLLTRLRVVARTQESPRLASFVPPVAPLPRPAAPERRTGVRAASVPTILLGLGAFCLLVASVIFLAVAWSWLGVGGRTAVLLTLTAGAGVLGQWLARRGLRVAGEALTTVALGLLVLDVVGAENSGWLGALTDEGLFLVVGVVVAAVSLSLALTPTRLLAPQLAGVVGLGVAAIAAFDLTQGSLWLAGSTVVVFTAVVELARRVALPVLLWSAATGGAVAWMVLTTYALAATDDGPMTFASLWSGPGWALLAASGMLLLPLAFHRGRETVVCAVAAAACLTSLTLALPAGDESATVLATVALGLLVAWTAAAVLVPRAWTVVALVPACAAALPVLVVSGSLSLQATVRTLAAGQQRGARVSLEKFEALVHPALLLPSLAALLALVAVALPTTRGTAGRVAAVSSLAAAGVATLALHPVPLWSVVVILALAGTALVADSLRRETGIAETVAGLLVLGSALLAGRSSEVLVTGALALVTLASVALVTRGWSPESRPLGDLLLPAALTGLIWSGAGLADVDPVLRGVPILLVVGLLAIARSRVELEASAVVAGSLAALASVLAAQDLGTAASVHLTVGGVVVSASGLLHRRRATVVAGGALLFAATWVRLADLGVEAPEAYTLPLAVVLTLVGLHAVLRRDEASTSALTPGLVLATVPSLLWVLAGDPVSVRAVLLGATCLVLVLAGSRLRWSSPLVVGAAAGGLLVLRELAPYVAETPQWVLLGLAGTLLTVVGVTWERRLVELRSAGAYLERLR